MNERHPDRSLPNWIILWSVLWCMCLYVGVQETFSSISGLVWEAVLYLNSKLFCLAFSKRRDSLLRADIFVSTSAMEVSGPPKLPLCAGLITTYWRRGIRGWIALLQGQVWKLFKQLGGPVLSNRGRASGQSCQSTASHPQYTSLFLVCCLFPPAPVLKLKILEICSNISTWPCYAEAAKQELQQG